MNDNRGFTLIEVLIVVVIIGVLAGTALAKYDGMRSRGFDARVVSSLRGVATGQEAYYASNRVYTDDLATLAVTIGEDVDVDIDAGNSGDIATSFRVTGSHPAAGKRYAWVSDPADGEPHLSVVAAD